MAEASVPPAVPSGETSRQGDGRPAGAQGGASDDASEEEGLIVDIDPSSKIEKLMISPAGRRLAYVAWTGNKRCKRSPLQCRGV